MNNYKKRTKSLLLEIQDNIKNVKNTNNNNKQVWYYNKKYKDKIKVNKDSLTERLDRKEYDEKIERAEKKESEKYLNKNENKKQIDKNDEISTDRFSWDMLDLKKHSKKLEDQISSVTQNMQDDFENIEKMIEKLMFNE